MNIQEIKKAAEKVGAQVVFNRALGGYQITKGFSASEPEHPFYDEKGNKHLTEYQINKLYAYLNFYE